MAHPEKIQEENHKDEQNKIEDKKEGKNDDQRRRTT